MTRRSRNGVDAGLGLSFLDVLSNGLGVAVLLFIVLSSMRSAGEVAETGGEHFIRLKWTVFDPQAIIQAWIAPPGGSADPRDFFPLQEADNGSQIFNHPQAKGKVVLFGFTDRGSNAALPAGKKEARVYVMRIQAPDEGKWRFGALYVNRADALAAMATEPVKVSLEVQVSNNRLAPLEKSIMFAEEVVFHEVEVIK